MNSFGKIYSFTTFGESHGPAIGGVIDGMPPGIPIDLEAVQRELDRRRPGQSSITTARNEADRVEILSGIFEGKTTGTPIGFVIRNTDQHSTDYEEMREVFRPSHADYTYQAKYGIRDYRGGGRSSARETACRVVAGAFARQALELEGITIEAYTSQIGNVTLGKPYTAYDLSTTEDNIVRCPDPDAAMVMESLIRLTKEKGDTVGGVVTCVIHGMPVGVGEPVYDKLQAQLAAAMLGINAAKGFDYGMGFDGAALTGSQTVDRLLPPDNDHARPRSATNYSGGIQGGISNGEDIYFRVAFKPVATMMQPVQTVDIHGNPVTLTAKGRHDPCVVPRAVPVVEAMAAVTLLDALLQSKARL